MPQGPLRQILMPPPVQSGPPVQLDQTPLAQTNPGLARLVDFFGGLTGLKDALVPDSSNATVAGAGLGAALPLMGVLGSLKRVGQPITAYHGSPHDTLQFKKWFGNSKVLDEAGKPLTVYHGTAGDFDEFKLSRSGEFGPAAYFTDTAREAGDYTGTNARHVGAKANVIPAKLRMEKPFVVKNSPDEFWAAFPAESDEASIALAKSQGYDGVIYRRPDQKYVDGKGIVPTGEFVTHYAVFDPKQIKSSIGNSGAFDPKNPSIVKAP